MFVIIKKGQENFCEHCHCLEGAIWLKNTQVTTYPRLISSGLKDS